MNTRRIRAGRHELVLHTLQEKSGDALLLLHALWGSNRDWSTDASPWPGPVFALDFSGHGESQWVKGGGYYPELFAADADAALSEIGACHLLGAGIGAYVALLLAGARPDDVRGAVLTAGRGLAGQGPVPDFDDMVRRSDGALEAFAAPRDAPTATDPMVAMVETDVRPLDYACAFGRRARRIVLAGSGEPAAWWKALREVPAVTEVAASGDAVRSAATVFHPATLSTKPAQG